MQIIARSRLAVNYTLVPLYSFLHNVYEYDLSIQRTYTNAHESEIWTVRIHVLMKYAFN